MDNCITTRDKSHYWDNYKKEGSSFYFLHDENLNDNNLFYKLAIVVTPGNEISAVYKADDNTCSQAEADSLLNKYKVDPTIFVTNINVEEILPRYIKGTISKNADGTLNVNGDVLIVPILTSGQRLMVKFKKVTGRFSCQLCGLTTLEGCPEEVGGSFNCYNNELTNLIGGPKKVGMSYDCQNNYITSLEGSPKEIRGDFFCNDNRLSSLKGCPERVLYGHFECDQYSKKFTKEEIAEHCIVGATSIPHYTRKFIHKIKNILN